MYNHHTNAKPTVTKKRFDANGQLVSLNALNPQSNMVSYKKLCSCKNMLKIFYNDMQFSRIKYNFSCKNIFMQNHI